MARRKRHRQALPRGAASDEDALVRDRRRRRPHPSRLRSMSIRARRPTGASSRCRRIAWRWSCRTERNASALTASVVRAIHEIDPEQPVYDVRTMDEWVDRSLGQRWMNMTLVGTFASVALDPLRDRRLRRDRVRRGAAAPRVRHPPRARREPARHRDIGRDARARARRHRHRRRHWACRSASRAA